jgi:hypothetical protein
MDKQFAKSPIERKMTGVTSSYLGALVVLCIALGVAVEGRAQESEHHPEMIAGKSPRVRSNTAGIALPATARMEKVTVLWVKL